MIIDPFSRKVIHLTGQARSFQASIADESGEDLIKSANVALRLTSGLTRLARRAGDINIF